jgi:hypothetical protein
MTSTLAVTLPTELFLPYRAARPVVHEIAHIKRQDSLLDRRRDHADCRPVAIVGLLGRKRQAPSRSRPRSVNRESSRQTGTEVCGNRSGLREACGE